MKALNTINEITLATTAGATLALALLFTTSPISAQNKIEGSRPGQTYRTGEAAPPQPVNQQQAPGQYAPVPQQPVMQQPMQAQTPLPVQGRTAPATAASASQRALPAGTPVIMEFSDLQCPDSARYNNGIKSNVMQQFVGENKAEYQWHDFPLPNHEQADEAAAAARCAGAAADRMRQLIMDNQGQMSTDIYAQYARQLGINSETFTACMRNGATMREVQQDKALGQSMGVSGTPTLVLGTADGRGGVQPAKVVKAYNPPQQVLAEIDNFMAQANTSPQAGAVQ